MVINFTIIYNTTHTYKWVRALCTRHDININSIKSMSMIKGEYGLWRLLSVLLVEETEVLPQVIDNLYHIMLYRIPHHQRDSNSRHKWW
jgi:hypothetical protein